MSRSPDDLVPAAGRPVVAAFDFDGTLTEGGSVWPFLAAVAGPWAVARAAAGLLPALVRAAVLGGHHADTAKEALFARTLTGRDAAEVAAQAAVFGRAHYQRHRRPDLHRRLEWHRRQGHRLVIVSASPELYLRPVAEELGVDGVVATRLAVGPDGRLTGRYDGLNCRGSEKMDRLRRWIETAGAAQADGDEPFVWAYGNSGGDRQLLAGADVGVDVGKLGRFGKLRRFPRLRQVPDADL